MTTLITKDRIEKIKEGLLQTAKEQTSPYPQYENHFKDYVLVRLHRRIKTKAGVAFESGEFAIARPYTTPHSFPLDNINGRDRVVWSRRNGVDTVISNDDVESVEEKR